MNLFSYSFSTDIQRPTRIDEFCQIFFFLDPRDQHIKKSKFYPTRVFFFFFLNLLSLELYESRIYLIPKFNPEYYWLLFQFTARSKFTRSLRVLHVVCSNEHALRIRPKTWERMDPSFVIPLDVPSITRLCPLTPPGILIRSS